VCGYRLVVVAVLVFIFVLVIVIVLVLVIITTASWWWNNHGISAWNWINGWHIGWGRCAINGEHWICGRINSWIGRRIRRLVCDDRCIRATEWRQDASLAGECSADREAESGGQHEGDNC
jgi:hypothetical protein